VRREGFDPPSPD